jgi:Holliday junction resolvase
MEIEDITANLNKKKKKNSGTKGKRTERSLCKILSERFGPGFSRTIGSGNRVWQVGNMPKCAQDTFTGDIVTPEGFLWTFESKGGYDIDFNSIFGGGSAELDSFIKQVELEGNRTGRKPVIAWKKDRRPWLVILKTADLNKTDWPFRFIYRDWSVIALNDFLTAEDSYFLKRSG